MMTAPPQRHARIAETCVPFLVASSLGAARHPRAAPAAMRLAPLHRVDPHRVAAEPFLLLLKRLDELVYGPAGMALPQWGFYDCAEVPGGIFGFAQPAERMSNDVRAALRVPPGESGLVPLSMLVAIPMLPDGAWNLFGLCSVDACDIAAAGSPSGLRVLTMAAGLAVLGATTAYGAAQWSSDELAVQARFAPLELLTAWTPAHSYPQTVTWRFQVTPEVLTRALDPSAAAAAVAGARHWVDCNDDAAQQALQARLEAGARLTIAGPPQPGDRSPRVPLGEVAP